MQAIMKLMGSSIWSFTHMPATYLLLCSPIPSRSSGTPTITHETRWILPTAFCSLPVFLKCPFSYLSFSIQHTKVKKRPGNSPFCVMCQRSGLNYPLRSSFQGTWLTAEVSPPAPFTSLGLLMNRLFIQNRFLFRYRWFTILYNF